MDPSLNLSLDPSEIASAAPVTVPGCGGGRTAANGPSEASPAMGPAVGPVRRRWYAASSDTGRFARTDGGGSDCAPLAPQARPAADPEGPSASPSKFVNHGTAPEASTS